MPHRILILASGAGTLTQAIIDAKELDIEIVAVISDRSDAAVLVRAREAKIDCEVVAHEGSRAQWDSRIIERVGAYQPDLVVSAGFMKILPADFVQRFPTINSHPALLPDFPGAHAVRDALNAQVGITGATVHWVDAGVDTGPIITSMQVPIVNGDTEEILHERIKKVERALIVASISLILPTLETHV